MKKCPVCRSQIDDNAKFCVYCGTDTKLSGIIVLLYIAVALIVLSLFCLFGIIFEEGDITAHVYLSAAFAIPGIIILLIYWSYTNNHLPNAYKNKMMLIRPGAWMALIIALIAWGWIIFVPAAVGIVLAVIFCRHINACINEAENSKKYIVALEAQKKAIIEHQKAVSEKHIDSETDIRKNITVDSDAAKSKHEYTLQSENDKRAAFSAELMSLPRIEINVPNIQTVRRDSSSMPAIKFSNITKKTNLKKIFPLVVVDVETTGLSPDNDEIIEVSAIKYNYDFTPSSCFTTLLKPSGHIPSRATAINNITDDMVAGCRSFLEVAPSLGEYISGCNVCGHNLLFDLKFLFCGGADLPKEIKYFDTLDIAKRTLKKQGGKEYDPDTGKYVEITDYDVTDYKLNTLCDYYDIQRMDAHRSLSDCLATGKLLKCLVYDKLSTENAESM